MSARGYPLETAVVHVADILVNTLELGTSGEALVPPLSSAAGDLVGLDPSAMPEIITEFDVHLEESLRAFGMEIE